MIIRNSILRYLKSAAVFDGANDQGSNQQQQQEEKKPEKTQAEVDREKIMASMTKWPGDKEEEKKEEKEEEKEEEEEKDDDDEEIDEEKKPDETDEQKKERIAKAKEERRQSRIQKRIDKLTASNGEKDEEIKRLRKQLEAKPDANLTEEEVEKRAAEKAKDELKKRDEAEGAKLFQKNCDTLQEAANKVDKEFDKKIHAIAEEIAPINPNMIGILANELDHENGGEVLAYLANNEDDYEDINGMVNIVRMTKKLIRISDKLHAEKEAKKKAEEKAAKEAKKKEALPEPINPISTGRDAASANVLPENPTKDAASMERFVQIRNRQEAEARKAKLGF